MSMGYLPYFQIILLLCFQTRACCSYSGVLTSLQLPLLPNYWQGKEVLVTYNTIRKLRARAWTTGFICWGLNSTLGHLQRGCVFADVTTNCTGIGYIGTTHSRPANSDTWEYLYLKMYNTCTLRVLLYGNNPGFNLSTSQHHTMSFL